MFLLLLFIISLISFFFLFIGKTIDTSFGTTINELNLLSTAEEVLAFHGMKHSHSYLFQSCTINIMKTGFPDSSIANTVPCDKTKVKNNSRVKFFNLCHLFCI